MIIEFDFIKTLLLAILIVLVPVSIVALIKSYFDHKEGRISPVQDEKNAYKSVLKEAQKTAKSLLYQTTSEAIGIISKTKQTNEHAEENLDKTLQNIAQKNIHSLNASSKHYEESYQHKLDDVQKEIYEDSQKVIQETREKSEQTLTDYTNNLLAEVTNSKDEINKKVAEKMAVIEQDLAEYKKTKIEKIDQDIEELIKKTYKDVLKISVPENLNRELVLKSLEEAKKEGMFNL